MRPIVLAAAAYLLGCAAGAIAPAPAGFALVTVLVTVAVAAAHAFAVPRPATAGVAALFFTAGAANAGSAVATIAGGCAALLEDGATVSAVGHFTAMQNERRVAPFEVTSARVSRGTGRASGCGGVVRVKLPDPARGGGAGSIAARDVTPGATVRVTGRWWAGTPASVWPAPPERRGVLIADRVATAGATARAGSRRPDDGAEIPAAGSRLSRLRGAVQARVREVFGPRAGLVEALVLARSEQIEPTIRTSFVDSGLAHLLAISGSHVGLVAGVLLLLLRAARLRAQTAACAAAAGTLAYVAFIGAPHAAARAAVQITLLIAARVLQRPADPYALLAAAALVVAGFDPLAPLSPGFQLSFAGILGIIAARRPLLERMPERLPRWLADGLATGVAASLATMPIAALHFGQLAIIGIPATLAAMPVLGAAVPGIGLTLLASLASDTAAAFLAGGTAVLLDALVRLAGIAAAVPGGHGYVTQHGVLAALAATAAAIIAIAVMRDAARQARGRDHVPPGASPAAADAAARSSGRARLLAAAGAAGAVIIAAPALARGFAGGHIEIHAIDVGQGDALAIRTPANRWILVDAGPRTESYDAGRARVLPFLRRHGVRRVDVLVLSHPHSDHIGGAAAILDAVDVGIVVDPAVPFANDQYVETLTAADHRPARWLVARDGRVLRIDDVTLRFVAPDSAALDDTSDPNDYSAVFRLEFGAFVALFLGDAPAAVENRIVRPDDARFTSSLIKVGHHGSRTSSGDSLLDTMRPGLALISVGTRNRYGHPDPSVLRRLHDRGITVLRTDLHGTIRVRVDRDGRFDVAAAG